MGHVDSTGDKRGASGDSKEDIGKAGTGLDILKQIKRVRTEI